MFYLFFYLPPRKRSQRTKREGQYLWWHTYMVVFHFNKIYLSSRYHDDLEIEEDSDNHDIHFTNDQESTLTIQAANRNSSGVYKCTVSNQIGSTDSINQQIDVHCK